MTAIWPTTLPIPNRQGYQKARAEARQKTNMDAGPARYRLMSSAVTDPVQLTITVDRNGKEIFDRFFVEDTSRGSLPFLMPDPATDGWAILDEADLYLLDENDELLLFNEVWLCTFGDTMPSEAIEGLNFNIAFTVGVMP